MDHFYQSKNKKEKLIHKISMLEDSYAEALADNADAQSLRLLWRRIKLLKKAISDDEETSPVSETAKRSECG